MQVPTHARPKEDADDGSRAGTAQPASHPAACCTPRAACIPAGGKVVGGLQQVVHAADEHLSQLPARRVVSAVCVHVALLLLLQRPVVVHAARQAGVVAVETDRV